MFFLQMPALLFGCGEIRFEFRHLTDGIIVFQQFDGDAAGGNVSAGMRRIRVDFLDESGDRFVNGVSVMERCRRMGVFGEKSFSDALPEMIHAAASGSDRLYDFRSEIFFDFADLKLKSFFARFIHHIEDDQHGDSEFRQLSGQIETALRN